MGVIKELSVKKRQVLVYQIFYILWLLIRNLGTREFETSTTQIIRAKGHYQAAALLHNGISGTKELIHDIRR